MLEEKAVCNIQYMYSLMLHSNAEKKITNTLPNVIRIELILITFQHQMIYLPEHGLQVLSISQEYACTMHILM